VIQAVHLMVDISRAGDGRVEGTVQGSEDGLQPFSGTLELLKVLEDFLENGDASKPFLAEGARDQGLFGR
jgi:hypothetical protein